jgi:hypothetical protein
MNVALSGTCEPAGTASCGFFDIKPSIDLVRGGLKFVRHRFVAEAAASPFGIHLARFGRLAWASALLLMHVPKIIARRLRLQCCAGKTFETMRRPPLPAAAVRRRTYWLACRGKSQKQNERSTHQTRWKIWIAETKKDALVEITGASSKANAPDPTNDAVVPGTNFQATGNVPCAHRAGGNRWVSASLGWSSKAWERRPIGVAQDSVPRSLPIARGVALLCYV